jgi:FtsH-binding integral membrane protein
MFIGWGVFLQFGALFARYAKRFPNAIWFKIHRPFQTVGYIIALIGFILAIVMTHPAHYAVQPHTGLGLAVMVLGSLQMSIAMFRPEPTKKGEKPTIWRRLFEFQHWYVGRVALILAVITIFFGLQAIGAGVGLYIAYGVLVAIEFIAYVVLEILRLMRRESDERGCY